MNQPKILLLFSGKRKSGKDFICDNLKKKLGDEKCGIVRISGPVKGLYAAEHRLDFDELLSDGPYKEKYRREMINWSDGVRRKDPGYFCRKTCEEAPLKNVWIVSDVRRKTDVKYFKEIYGDKVKTIRISCDNDVRKQRGYIFTKGVDDVASECDLDDFKEWDVEIQNNNREDYEESLKTILEMVEKFV